MYILRKFLKILIGFLIILFFLYRFIILEHLPYNITAHITALYLMILSIFCITKLFEVLSVCKILLFSNYSSTLITLLLKKFVTIFFYNPLELIGTFLLKDPLIKKIITYLSTLIFLLKIRTPSDIILLLTLYQYLPLVLLSVYLCIDIFVLDEILLFYKFLWLILWVYILRSFLGLLYINTEQELHEIENIYFTVQISLQLEPMFFIKKDVPNLLAIKHQWVQLYNLKDLLKALHLYRTKSRILLCLQLFTALLFFLGWFVFVIKVLFLKTTITLDASIYFKSLLIKLFSP